MSVRLPLLVWGTPTTPPFDSSDNPGRSNAAPGFTTTNREAKRRKRVERLLSGELRRLIKPASELAFDYDAASRIAIRSNQT